MKKTQFKKTIKKLRNQFSIILISNLINIKNNKKLISKVTPFLILIFFLIAAYFLEEELTIRNTLSKCELKKQRSLCYGQMATNKLNTKICNRLKKRELIDSCLYSAAFRLKDLSLCNQIRNDKFCDEVNVCGEKKYCTYVVIESLNSEQECKKIKDNHLFKECINNLVKKQDLNYQSIAITKKDKSYCEKIKDRTRKENCKNILKEYQTTIKINKENYERRNNVVSLLSRAHMTSFLTCFGEINVEEVSLDQQGGWAISHKTTNEKIFPENISNCSLSPDRKKIAYGFRNKVVIVDLINKINEEIPIEETCYLYTWSPNSRYITFQCSTSGVVTLLIYDSIKKNNLTSLTTIVNSFKWINENTGVYSLLSFETQNPEGIATITFPDNKIQIILQSTDPLIFYDFINFDKEKQILIYQKREIENVNDYSKEKITYWKMSYPALTKTEINEEEFEKISQTNKGPFYDRLKKIYPPIIESYDINPINPNFLLYDCTEGTCFVDLNHPASAVILFPFKNVWWSNY